MSCGQYNCYGKPNLKTRLSEEEANFSKQSHAKLISRNKKATSFESISIGSNHKTNPFLLIFIILHCCFLAKAGLSFTNFNSNGLNDMTVTFLEFATSVTAGSVVVLTLPVQYPAIYLYRNRPYSGFDVNADFCPIDCNPVIVTYSAYTLTLENMFPSNTALFMGYTIFGVQNPSYQTTTNDFTLKVLSADRLTEFHSQTVTGIEIKSQEFTPTPTLTLGFPYLWSVSNLDMSLTIPTQTDYLRVTFPSRWENQSRVDSTLSDTILVTSTSHEISFNKVALNVDIYLPELSPTNPSPETTNINVNIKSISTPSSVIDLTPITLSAYNKQNRIIRQSTLSVPSTELQNDKLRQVDMYPIYDASNNEIEINVNFTMPRDVLSTDRIVLVYPSELSIASTTTTDYQIYVEDALTGKLPTIYTGNNSIQFQPFSSTSLKIKVRVLLRMSWPRASSQISNVTVQAKRKIGASTNYALMDSNQCCSMWIKQKPTLTATVTLNNSQRLSQSAEYTFTLTHQFTSLLPSDSLLIQFPSEYVMSSAQSATVCGSVTLNIPSSPSNVNSSYICSLSDNTLTLSSLVLANQAANTQLQVKMTLTNPSQTPNENFQIWSEDSVGQRIESDSDVSVTISAASLSSVTITPSSTATYAKADYILELGVVGDINANSIVQIKLPSEIDVFGKTNSLKCLIQTTESFCSYDTSTKTVRIRAATNISVIPVTVRLNNLLNPQSTAETSQFQINVYTSQNTLAESSSSLSVGLTTQMATLSDFLFTQMQMTGLSNDRLNEEGVLQFLIVLPYNLVTGNVYQLSLSFAPNDVLILSDSDFTLELNSQTIVYVSGNSTSTYSISVNFTEFTSNLQKNLILVKLDQVTILQDNITCSIKIFHRNDIVASQFDDSLETSAPISLSKNLSAVLLSDYTMSQTNYFLNQFPGSITLTINSIPSTIQWSYAVILVPTNYQGSGSGAEYSHNTTDNSTTVISIPTTDLTNPTQVTKELFSFVLYDSSHRVVALSESSTTPSTLSQQYFDVQCSLPCRACKSLSESSQCADCYNLPLIVSPMIYFRELTADSPYGQCTDNCFPGEYLDVSQRKCLPCDTNCSTCLISSGTAPSLTSGNPSQCLSCQAGQYLYSGDNRCYVNCPSGTYPNELICSTCIDNCELCSELNTCTQCASPFVLYTETTPSTVSLCLESCPLKYTAVQITPTTSSTFRCNPCTSNCLTCPSDPSICTMCDVNFFLYNNQCYVSCPSIGSVQLLPNKKSECVSCQCATCNTLSYNCTSCVAGQVLDSASNQCLSNGCENGWFNMSGICTACTQSGCIKCLNGTFCQLCQEPLILYKQNTTHSDCVASCPTSTLLTIETTGSDFALECLPCSEGCAVCTIKPDFCTSCETGYVFSDNQCLNTCPSPLHNISGFCQTCANQCLTCSVTNPSNCSECAQSYYLHEESCLSVCPASTYEDIRIKKCLSCQSLCETCLNATHCTSCQSGYFLFTNNLCYDSCPTIPTFYYEYNGLCTLCQPQCTSCLSTPIQCSSCSSDLYLFNVDTKQCTTECADGYFVDNNGTGSNCIQCQKPCLTCDTTYYSCISCDQASAQKYLFEGNCLSSCPDGYFAVQNVQSGSTDALNSCKTCAFPCLTCTQSQCLTCETFAFMYKESCVLTCAQTIDLPFERDTYCTNCLAIPFCTICGQTQASEVSCFSCTYPYVLFEGECLNNCPTGFTVELSQPEGIRTCVESAQYILQKQQIYEENKPKFPFSFLVVFVLMGLLVSPLSSFFYPYTYHLGYWIFLLNLLDYCLVYVWLIDNDSRYTGEYVDGDDRNLPLVLIIVGLVCNLCILGWLCFGFWVIKSTYCQDSAYSQWKDKHFFSFVAMLSIGFFVGPRTHKLFYSKLFGSEKLAYRIISVQKFQNQDRVNFLSCFGDLFFLSAFFIIAYNVFIQYSVLYLTAIEILVVKLLLWILLALDSKKPDRGFFYGDQKIAIEEMQKEQQERQAQLKRMDTDSLIKMIRRKSAGLLQYDKQPFGQIEIKDYISVYNPDDYEEVVKVPNRKIKRAIEKGKFRKGRKITIDEKLERFADSIKPKPEIVEDSGYLKGLIYWKPPKILKATPVKVEPEPLSQESMLQILVDKQMQYKDEFDEVENIIFDDEPKLLFEEQNQHRNYHNFKTGQHFYDRGAHYRKQSYNELEDSIQSFEDLSSQIYRPDAKAASQNQKDVSSIEYNDLMNLNYAKRKHLPKQEKRPKIDSNEMRILYHEPMKKRRNNQEREHQDFP